jgi:uncharacterized integral membrane protein
MNIGYLAVAVLAASVTVFALQNTEPAAVRFALWRLEGAPIATLVLAALGSGVVIGGLPLWIRLAGWRRRARALETRVAMLERAVEERNRQLLSTPIPRRAGE